MPWREAEPEDGVAYESGCWIWTGYTDERGTPVVRTATSTTTARRAAYERENGPVPEGRVLYAMCGTRLCVRPRHHEPVTTRTLRYRQGRTKADRAMRKTALHLRLRGISGRQIAERLDVDEGTVRRVLAGRHYDPTKEETRQIRGRPFADLATGRGEPEAGRSRCR